MSQPLRVLVVDDDATTQRIMRLFLEKSGYEAQIVATAKEGLAAASADDAAPIIVLDWMLPDMDGPTVCKRLREAKPKLRPYIIFLSSKQEKTDVSVALDSGADDYVTKPFNVVEFQARLRVARRTVEYQKELLKQLSDNESLSQRNNLLGELITKKQKPAEKAAEKGAAQPETHSPISRFTANELKFTMAASLLEARLALEGFQVDTGGLTVESHTSLAWAGLAVSKPGSWFDVVLSIKTEEAGLLLQKSLGRDPKGPREALDFAAELARIMAAGFGRMMRGRHGESQAPLMSRALSANERGPKFPVISDGDTFRVTVEGVTFRLLTSRTVGSKRAVGTGELKPLDILAAPFPPPAVSAIPLFKEGVILTARFLEKLRYQVETTQVGGAAEIWRPSSLATYFNPEG